MVDRNLSADEYKQNGSSSLAKLCCQAHIKQSQTLWHFKSVDFLNYVEPSFMGKLHLTTQGALPDAVACVSVVKFICNIWFIFLLNQIILKYESPATTANSDLSEFIYNTFVYCVTQRTQKLQL